MSVSCREYFMLPLFRAISDIGSLRDDLYRIVQRDQSNGLWREHKILAKEWTVETYISYDRLPLHAYLISLCIAQITRICKVKKLRVPEKVVAIAHLLLFLYGSVKS